MITAAPAAGVRGKNRHEVSIFVRIQASYVYADTNRARYIYISVRAALLKLLARTIAIIEIRVPQPKSCNNNMWFHAEQEPLRWYCLFNQVGRGFLLGWFHNKLHNTAKKSKPETENLSTARAPMWTYPGISLCHANQSMVG